MLTFHIGFPKTGTTSLQTDFYPSLIGHNFIGRKRLTLKDQNKLYSDICKYCFHRRENLKLKKGLIAQLASKSNDSLIFCEEWFLSDYSGFYGFKGAVWQEKLRRLSSLVRNLDHQIIVFLRDPYQGIFSQYVEFQRVGIKDIHPTFLDYSMRSNDSNAYFYNELSSFLKNFFTKVYFIDFKEITNNRVPKQLSDIFKSDRSIKILNHNSKKSTSTKIYVENYPKYRKYYQKYLPNFLRIFLKKIIFFRKLKNYLETLSYQNIEVSIPEPEEQQKVENKYRNSKKFLDNIFLSG